MHGICFDCGESATGRCDASGCQNEMCDAHMYSHLVPSFERLSETSPVSPVQWFCQAHKTLADCATVAEFAEH